MAVNIEILRKPNSGHRIIKWLWLIVCFQVVATIALAEGLPKSGESTPPANSRWVNANLEDYSPENSVPRDPEEGTIGVGEPPPGGLNWENHLKYSEYCIVGTVAGVRYECIYRDGWGAQSLAIGQFQIEKMYWGPEAKTLILETVVERADCKVFYDNPRFASLEIGEKFFVVGISSGRGNFLGYFNLMKFNKDSVVAANKESWPLAYVERLVQAEVLSRSGEERK